MKCPNCNTENHDTLQCCHSKLMKERLEMMGITNINYQSVCGACAVEDDIYAAAEKATRDMNREREHQIFRTVTSRAEFPVTTKDDIDIICTALKTVYDTEPLTTIRVEIIGIERTLEEHQKRFHELYGK